MEGLTQWISDDEDDDEIHGAAAGNDQEGQQVNDNNEVQQDDQEPAHPTYDIYAGEDSDKHHVMEEDEDTRAPLTSVVRDSHLKELLLKKTTNSRSAVSEQSKMVQLEIDSNTPLYPDCEPDGSRLKVALDVLQMKARYKWSDVSIDAVLQYWQIKLPKENTCLKSCDKAKKIVCPFDYRRLLTLFLQVSTAS